MTADLPRQDLLLVDRYLDGALSPDEMVAVKRRFEADPGLRAMLRDRQALRRGFAAGRGDVVAAPSGFAAQVVAAARRLPVVDIEVAAAATVLCRRVMFAAAALLLAALLWQSGLFAGNGDGTLQAAPDEAQQVIDELDAAIARSGGVVRGEAAGK